MSPRSTSPPPERLKGARTKDRETSRIPARCEDLGVQPGGSRDVHPGQIREPLPNAIAILNDEKGTPRDSVPTPPHLATARTDVNPVFCALKILAHSEGFEQSDRLRHAVDFLERVLNDDR